MKEILFKNTFAPRFRNDRLSIYGIIQGLKMDVINYDDLSDEIKKKVTQKLE